jgi:hypothetical protein
MNLPERERGAIQTRRGASMKRHSRWFILACFAASGALCALRPLPANAAEESKPAGKLTQQQ